VREAPQAEEQPAQTKTGSSKSLQATQTDDDDIVQPTDGHDGIADNFTTLGLHDHWSTGGDEGKAPAAHDSTAADNKSEGK
jgi:hypothetical protein